MKRLQADNTVEPLAENIGGQRSKFDVMATILHICLEGSLKNHIIGKGNFSDAMANHYLTILLYHNLLESSKNEGRTYYRTTDKGRQFIRHYMQIQDLFSRNRKSTDILVADNDLNALKSEKQSQVTKRILIVDDESDITSAMKIGLEDNSFSVTVFNDPVTALASYKPGSYELLILDVKMPKMNGFELYREIRKLDEKVQVCFLTAFEIYIDEFKRVFPSMDVNHLIQKPIAMPDLLGQIRKLTE